MNESECFEYIIGIRFLIQDVPEYEKINNKYLFLR